MMLFAGKMPSRRLCGLTNRNEGQPKDMATTTFRIAIRRVSIIESKEPTEHHNGEEIQRRFQRLAYGSKLPCSYSKASTVAELLEAIKDEIQFTASLGAPILHVEAHGTTQGIETADGGVALWQDLKGPLERLNKVAKGNLVVLVGACHGAHLGSSIAGEGAIPFAAYVALSDEVRSVALLNAWERFYDAVVATGDFNKAILAANVSLRSNGSSELEITTAFEIMIAASQEFEKFLYHRTAIRSRAHGIYRSIHRAFPPEHRLCSLPYFRVIDMYEKNVRRTLANALQKKLGITDRAESPLGPALAEYLADLPSPRRRPKGKSWRRTINRAVRDGKFPNSKSYAFALLRNFEAESGRLKAPQVEEVFSYIDASLA